MGRPRSHAMQTIGKPSGGQRSLASNVSLNSGSDRLFTRKLRLGVDKRKAERLAAAASIFSTTVAMLTASIGIPNTQKTGRERFDRDAASAGRSAASGALKSNFSRKASGL